MVQEIKIKRGSIKKALYNVWFYVPIILQIFITSMISTGTNVNELQTWDKVSEVLMAYVSNPVLLFSLAVQVYGQLKTFDKNGKLDDVKAIIIDDQQKQKDQIVVKNEINTSDGTDVEINSNLKESNDEETGFKEETAEPIRKE